MATHLLMSYHTWIGCHGDPWGYHVNPIWVVNFVMAIICPVNRWVAMLINGYHVDPPWITMCE